MVTPTQRKPASSRSRAGLVTWIAVAISMAAGFWFAGTHLAPPPPDRIVVATGPVGGGYAASGAEIRATLAQSGIDVELRTTAGSIENAALLATGAVDAAFVQGGVLERAEAERFQGIASLYYEPLWVFTHGPEPVRRLAELRGKRIEVGAEGSGTRAVSMDLLAANGVEATAATLLGHDPERAVDAVIDGSADALFLVTSSDSEVVRRLFAATDGGVPTVRQMPMERARAYATHFRFLQPVTLAVGMIQLVPEYPKQDIEMVAPAATLLGTRQLHPAIVPLLIEALQRRHADGVLFEKEGEFPSPRLLDSPVAPAAARYYRRGPSFLFRVFPFQVAAVVDRLWILVLPLLTLLIPLIRIAPPAYRWRIRSRIYKWYQFIMRVEQRVRSASDGATIRAAIAELDQVENEIHDVNVPLSYAEELYNLRMHIRFVRRDLERRDVASPESTRSQDRLGQHGDDPVE